MTWVGVREHVLIPSVPMATCPCQSQTLVPPSTLCVPARVCSVQILAEMGDSVAAKELLARSIQLSPAGGDEKYVLLGHLEAGDAAVAAFSTAARLLQQRLGDLEEEARLEEDAGRPSRGGGAAAGELRALRRRLGAVMAAQAKVYLTDMFEQEHALVRCEELLDRALRYDSENPEACQALADLRMTQGRNGEALLLAKRTKEICWRMQDGVAPTYDFRMVRVHRYRYRPGEVGTGRGGRTRRDAQPTQPHKHTPRPHPAPQSHAPPTPSPTITRPTLTLAPSHSRTRDSLRLLATPCDSLPRSSVRRSRRVCWWS